MKLCKTVTWKGDISLANNLASQQPRLANRLAGLSLTALWTTSLLTVLEVLHYNLFMCESGGGLADSVWS